MAVQLASPGKIKLEDLIHWVPNESDIVKMSLAQVLTMCFCC